ncbi:MAG: MBL fold metallo-hydrolase [Candidatus Eremiobacteraeota bacterium]|nr:MBL fold metallo-hydrolase [Candidatus Eremiobacteraeota bacterium]
MVALSDGVVRVRAPNPSPMTLTGTNTYLVRTSRDTVLVIDPGPLIDQHVDAILEAASRLNARIATILVTHGHPDHAPAAAPLAKRTGAPVLGHTYAKFPIDRQLEDDERLPFDDAVVTVIDAPGHALDHLVFATSGVLFTGDVVLGQGTTVVAPPGGAMRPYQNTLARLLREHGDARAIYGGHGEAVPDVRAKLVEYIEHRKMREQHVLDCLARGPATIPELVTTIYAEVDKRLWPAAARQMLAHLLALEEENRVVPHLLTRPPRPEEEAILDPNLQRIADPAAAAVAREELGTSLNLPLVEYRLA